MHLPEGHPASLISGARINGSTQSLSESTLIDFYWFTIASLPLGNQSKIDIPFDVTPGSSANWVVLSAPAS